MSRLFVVLVVALVTVTQVAAQGNTYPLAFEYDPDSDEYVAVVEVEVSAGDALQARITGAAALYFYVYDDDEMLYEGESLADFVAEEDGLIYVEVIASGEAAGELRVAGGGASDATGAGEFAEEACPFAVPSGVDVTCGMLTVPENREAGTDATIRLAVAIIGARDANPLPDPIFYLEGGPGGSALAGIDGWYNSPYRDQREIVVFDQRGTGFSEPSLNCPEMDDDTSTDAIEACRDRLLGEGVDLTAYNSRESAADVEALRLALGYAEINLYGISYGTRLALTMMRDHPAGIRAVIIDSVYPPNIDSNYHAVTDTFQIISMMFEDCAAQPACAAAFPDLEARFYEQLSAIADAPPLVTNADGEEEELYPQNVIDRLYEQLKTTSLVSAIPASLDAFASGDYDTYMELASNGAGDGASLAQELAGDLTADELAAIQEMVARNDLGAIADLLSDLFDLSADEAEQAAQGFTALDARGGDVAEVEPPDIDDDSEGMNMSVQCYEEMPFMDVDEAVARAEAMDMPDLVREALLVGILAEFDQCNLWPAGRASQIENEPVVSDIPTLVLSAPYDTATPSWWGDLAAETLSNSYNYHFPLVGHGVIDGGRCPVSIGIAFLNNPAVEPDVSCIATMNDRFWVPDAAGADR